MVIDATEQTADIIISRLRAEARRTREPRIVTVRAHSMRIAACALAWAQVMGYSTDTLGGDGECFRIWLRPAASVLEAA